MTAMLIVVNYSAFIKIRSETGVMLLGLAFFLSSFAFSLDEYTFDLENPTPRYFVCNYIEKH